MSSDSILAVKSDTYAIARSATHLHHDPIDRNGIVNFFLHIILQLATCATHYINYYNIIVYCTARHLPTPTSTIKKKRKDRVNSLNNSIFERASYNRYRLGSVDPAIQVVRCARPNNG